MAKYNLNILFTNNFPILEWSPYPDTVKYAVYRGENKKRLKKIAETLMLQYQDSSEEANIRTKMDRVNWYYQISSFDKNGKETLFSPIETLSPDLIYPYIGIYKEIVRRNNLMLDRINGESVDIYIKRNSGERCPTCFNQITRDIDTPSVLCPTCFNTSYVGGFDKLSDVRIKIRNQADRIVETPWGIRKESVEGKQGWLANYPIVHNGDFIWTKRGEIYMIDDVKHKIQQNFLTFQIFSVKFLETGNPYYSIDI